MMVSQGKGPKAFLGILFLTSMLVQAAPIRVLIFTPCGPSEFVMSGTSEAMRAFRTMLLHPSEANLGLAPGDIPREGFTVDTLSSPDGRPNGTTDQGDALISRLAATDVVIAVNNTDIGNLFTPAARTAFLAWIRSPGHGLAATVYTSDNNESWPAWNDSVIGARFKFHWIARTDILADTASADVRDPGYQSINSGLGYRYSLLQPWFFFRTNPRSNPGMHVLYTLNEGPFDKADRMGDHPICWYWTPYGKGRVYFSGLGWFPPDYDTSFVLRRQMYNGVLWASGRGAAPVSLRIQKGGKPETIGSIRISGTSLLVPFPRPGSPLVRMHALDGKQVPSETGIPDPPMRIRRPAK